ncbi:uncharacterized protein [Elaeis guineensis]|uniref:uncharacterized protein isoform X2 n=1 Tax=Elaeis guineensis var. tenera TaxID=51953 RepID=UPI003C6D51B0
MLCNSVSSLGAEEMGTKPGERFVFKIKQIRATTAICRRNGWWDHKLAPKNHQASFGQRFLFKSAHCKLFLWKRCSSDILFNTYSATCKNVPVLQKQMAFSYRRNFPNQKF